MKLKEKLQQDMKNALKSGDKYRLKVIRFLLSKVKNAEIDKGRELDENEMLSLIQKEVKKIEEAAEEFRKGGSTERAEEELKEAEILKEYLPEPLSEEEIEKIVDEVIESTGAEGMKDMGRVMKEVMARVSGRADGKKVNEMVRNRLGGQ